MFDISENKKKLVSNYTNYQIYFLNFPLQMESKLCHQIEFLLKYISYITHGKLSHVQGSRSTKQHVTH